MYAIYKNIIKNAQSELMRLTLLGLLTGLVAGCVIVFFRLVIDSSQHWLLSGNDNENYESLSNWITFILPLAGGVLLGIIFHFLTPEKRQTGVVHTLEYLKYHQAKLPITNAIVQFFGAAISIITGHSVGREGPCIHLGAVSGSAIAVRLDLPPKTRRTLLACGVSAAIAASFNTPLAGVVFAVEVILLEYTVASMLPMIIAASTAVLVSRLTFGDESALTAPAFEFVSNIEILGIILSGILIGLIAVVFTKLLVITTESTKKFPIFWRLSAAGGITGLLALISPEIMSIGYDTVNATFYSQFALGALLLILAMKIVATSVGLGLGLPGGLIGPTLFIGAVAGSAVGITIEAFYPENVIGPGVYAMIGMGAMMSATLQAPLAALLAIFELTHESSLILPGLIAIVFASLTSSEILRQPSIFVTLMRLREIKKPGNKLTGNTRLSAVFDIVDKYFTCLPDCPTKQQIDDSLNNDFNWVLVEENSEPVLAFRTSTLNAINFSQVETINILAFKNFGYSVAKIPSSMPVFDIAAQTNILKPHTVFVVYDDTEERENPPILGILHPNNVARLLSDAQTTT